MLCKGKILSLLKPGLSVRFRPDPGVIDGSGHGFQNQVDSGSGLQNMFGSETGFNISKIRIWSKAVSINQSHKIVLTYPLYCLCRKPRIRFSIEGRIRIKSTIV